MMDFKEFTTRAEQDIRAALEDASPGVEVGMNQVEKLQGESYTARMLLSFFYIERQQIYGTRRAAVGVLPVLFCGIFS